MLDYFFKQLFGLALYATERNLVPDFVIRQGIRKLLATRLKEESEGGDEAQTARKQAIIEELKSMPVAINTAESLEQHYEVPTEYFIKCLGRHLKYSCCLYPTGNESLDEAERLMLELYCERAQLEDGMKILELGCGWGSLSLFLASKYPNSKITAVSHSRTQKEHIDTQARLRGLDNLRVITHNMVDFEAPEAGTYDRCMSVEMFEHMKNYKSVETLEHMKNYKILLHRISTWLKPGGKLFVHIFRHNEAVYHFEYKDETDWMTKYFFQGGIMPSHDTLMYFQEDLSLVGSWKVSGLHYWRTCEDWLRNQDKNKAVLMPLFEKTYGAHQALQWFVRWRLFYLACAELFRYNNGEEWGVSFYLFENNKGAQKKGGKH